MPDLQRVFSSVADIGQRASAMARGRMGELNIAAIPALTGTCLALATARFRRLHPRVTVKVISVPSRNVLNRVIDSESQLGLVHGHCADPKLDTIMLAENPIVAILPLGHPLAADARVSIKDLANFELISLGHDNAAGALIAASFAKANAKLNIAVEITASVAAMAFVQAGVGIALVDAYTAETFTIEGVTVRQITPTLTLSAQVVLPASVPLSPEVAAFVGVLKQVAETHMGQRLIEVATHRSVTAPLRPAPLVPGM